MLKIKFVDIKSFHIISLIISLCSKHVVGIQSTFHYKENHRGRIIAVQINIKQISKHG